MAHFGARHHGPRHFAGRARAPLRGEHTQRRGEDGLMELLVRPVVRS